MTRTEPQDPRALFQQALGLHRAGQTLEAIAAYERVIQAAPRDFAAWGNRGVALRSLGRLREALASYDAAIAIKPDYADGHGNRGNVLQDLGLYDEARASLERACALSPKDAKTLNNLGNALISLGRPEDALPRYEAAITLKPDYVDALFNRGVALLALGRFAEGWRDYEHRFRTEPYVRQWAGLVSPEVRAAIKPGLSLSEIAGRHILVVTEQGVGDVIMFASMLPDLIKVAGRVSLLCQPRLRRLFSTSFPDLSFPSSDAADDLIAAVDHVLPIGSLGRLFRNDPADFPKRPYLSASPAVRAGWAERLGPTTARLRVGLSWRGGTPQTGAQDRSIALSDLRPLFGLPDCEFVSLQYGDPRDEIAAVNAGLDRPIRCFDPQAIDDFEDLAGLVQSLDIIVSVQTALVHVAGAVGAPTLAMNRRVVPYRYGRSTSTMPWYGAVELIRQDETLTWAPVIRRVAERLSQFIPEAGASEPRPAVGPPNTPAPVDPRVLFQRALGLHQAGRMLEAVAAYDQVIQAAPGDFASWGNRGVALRSLGRPLDALASYDAAIAIKPHYGEGHANRGNVLQDLGRFDEARASLERACALRPGDAVARNNLGNALMSLDRPEAALPCYEAAIALRPEFTTAHANRGLALARLERFDEALASYDAAIAMTPGDAKAHAARGKLLMDLQRDDEALPNLEAALALAPGDPAAHNQLGHALMTLGEVDTALARFETALTLAPKDADGRYNRGLTLLTLGRFAEGWRDYESRWDVEPYVRLSAGLVSPALRARLEPGLTLSDLVGRRILVATEQGMGDVIMFASMLPDLIRVAGQVSLLCPPRLRRLFAASFPGVTLLTEAAEAEVAAFDHILPIGSLGRLFRNRRQDFPGRPYLTVSDDVCAGWAERLGPSTTRLRVGLSWRGGTPKTGQRDRSIALRDLRPLLDLPDCEFVSLQYGDPRDEITAINAELDRPIRCFDPRAIDDFEDLAGLVRSLDVVVSVQTALVHVAGAMGAPTLAMARHVVPLRYGADRSSTPWYASVSLVSQDETRTWAPVIGRVAERLRDFAPPRSA